MAFKLYEKSKIKLVTISEGCISTQFKESYSWKDSIWLALKNIKTAGIYGHIHSINITNA